MVHDIEGRLKCLQHDIALLVACHLHSEVLFTIDETQIGPRVFGCSGYNIIPCVYVAVPRQDSMSPVRAMLSCLGTATDLLDIPRQMTCI